MKMPPNSYYLLVFILFLFVSSVSKSQGVAISANSEVNDPSAILDIQSTSRGLLIPRMTVAQRNAISNPAEGLIIYNTDCGALEFWNGTEWYPIGNAGSEGFITEWTTTVADETITLPLNSGNGSTFNCTVNWGDGNTSAITSVTDPDRVHTYASAGTYQVEIRGICEGWSFNNGGDRLKINRVISWGDGSVCGFSGFKYLRSGFYGCTNLTSIADEIPASGNGCTSSGFYLTFAQCSNLTSIPDNLFRHHTHVSTDGFRLTFWGCIALNSLPADLFRYNTAVSINGFAGTFYGCTALSSLPADLFKYNTLVSIAGFNTTFFGCTSLSSLPVDLFRYNTAASSDGFSGTFYGCTGLTSLPVDLFRYNTAVAANGFSQTFYGCTGLSSLPVDLFRYNTAVTTNGFYQTFYNCTNLQQNRNIFFADGEEGTRFFNQSPNFYQCFYRNSFAGTMGEAPPLWDCDFGTGTPTSTSCYGGAGNSAISLSNYGDIPVVWK